VADDRAADPKGWTGPKEVDGVKIEGTFRARQVPLAEVRTNSEHREQLQRWMTSYRSEELFDNEGQLVASLQALAPKGDQRMGANPHATGGLLLRDLVMPDFRRYAVPVRRPAIEASEATRVLGGFLRDVIAANRDRFRLMGPDETASNRLGAVFDATVRAWDAITVPGDDHLGPDGRVMEVLSEHLCEGWLEGYLLTGRHGLFNCYEGFIHIVDWMFNQHAKWLETTNHIPWRRPIASLNYLLSSHVWRQDHNGFSHFLPLGPRLHRPCRQQEGRDHPGVPAAGYQHAPIRGRSLPAQQAVRQRHRRREAARADLPDDAEGHRTLHSRPGHLAVGEQH
jgi:xylulose-5-phosphate/fructose-6-phosphate phosphoketolase